MRKARYGDTIAAKMKAAREALPALNVKHAVRSDMTIFNGAGAAPEVHALLDKARPEKVGGCVEGAWEGRCGCGLREEDMAESGESVGRRASASTRARQNPPPLLSAASVPACVNASGQN